MSTKTVLFAFTDTLAKRKAAMAAAGSTTKNTILDIRGKDERWTGKNDHDLAVANSAKITI